MRMDEGYQFGIGAFETIAVVKNNPVFLEEHVKRINSTLAFLLIAQKIDGLEVRGALESHPMEYGVVKIMASAENKLFLFRENPYRREQYQRGFFMDISEVRRNETSPLVFHKTLNYGDNFLERKRAKQAGLDETVFLNSRGAICEGSACNLFFVKKGRLYTPKLSCGMLPGILREWVCREAFVSQMVVTLQMLNEFEECFATNSLMGIMPVRQIGNAKYFPGPVGRMWMKRYGEEVLGIKDWPF